MVAPWFRAYSGSNSKMDFDAFLRFCRDFEIFPELCNKADLHQVFYSVAHSVKLVDTAAKKECISGGRFSAAIIQCATTAKSRLTSRVERVVEFVEKMAQSKGVEKVRRLAGKPRYELERRAK